MYNVEQEGRDDGDEELSNAERDGSTIVRLILYDGDVEGKSSREGEGGKEEEQQASEGRCVVTGGTKLLQVLRES